MLWRRGGKRKETLQLRITLEFEYLHRKIRCEMLIGGDDITNDVITLGTCFSIFAYIRALFRFALIGGNLTTQSTGAAAELEVEFKFQRRTLRLSFLFRPAARASPRACSQPTFVLYPGKIDFIRTY